ncbi:MAG: hypothetical protein AB1744_15075, partial [Candidatus Zixiibacteriota bacterium]
MEEEVVVESSAHSVGSCHAFDGCPGTPPPAAGSWAADVLRLSQKRVLDEINPIRVEAELVSAVPIAIGTALGARQARPLRDEKDDII